jgi:hypothetical protein
MDKYQKIICILTGSILAVLFLILLCLIMTENHMNNLLTNLEIHE